MYLRIKFVLATALFIIFLPELKAQEFSFGLKGGVNMVKVSNLRISNQIKPGFHFGFYSTYRPYRMDISITNEVNFSMKGVSLMLPDSLIENGQIQYSRSFNYVDLPLIINYHLGDNFYINGGLQSSLYAYFRRPSFHKVPYNKDNVNIIDFALILGAGINLETMGFGVRYNHSFIPTFQMERGKNHLLQFFLNYQLGGSR